MWNSKDFKTGRNEPCYCGSQLKFKKCCLDKTVIHTHHEDEWPKVSERILNLVSEYFDVFPEKTAQKNIITFACMAWNFAIANNYDDEDEKKERQKLIADCFPDAEAKQIFELILKDLVDKKQALYPDDNRIIAQFDVSEDKGGLNLQVASVMPGDNQGGEVTDSVAA